MLRASGRSARLGAGEAFRFRTDPRIEARQHLQEIQDLIGREANGKMSPAEADRGINELKSEYADNPFFAIEANSSLTSEQREQQLGEIRRQQRMKDFLANLLAFGLSGMLIAVCLSVAEPLIERNFTGVLVNGFVGAASGVVGGVLVSLFVEQLYATLIAGVPVTDEITSTMVLAHAVKWAVLGLFLTVGPGLVMRNIKKLAIGMVGGLIGGLIGGAMYDPIYAVTGSDDWGRLAALVVIGLGAGLGTGLIENAAKNGWLRVTAGLIAGKQFILYRNPTFIGSGPECPIYLFRDPLVGKRHAAIHIIPGGFELENLPLGSETVVNGKPISRTRLRSGDEIKIGLTNFLFQEKIREA